MLFGAVSIAVSAKGCAVALHAAAAARRGATHIFMAPSGGGKSTIAWLCHTDGMPVIGDEYVLVLERAGRFHARLASPRDLNGNVCNLPLSESVIKHVFFLRKAVTPGVERITPFSALTASLRSNSVIGLLDFAPSDRLIVLDRLIRFFRAVPAYILYFRKDNSFWKVIDELEEREARRGTS